MAVGIRPNAALAKEAGLETNRGVLVGDDMRTSDPDVFSVGECVEHRGLCYGLVAPLYEMAKVVAAQLAGDETAAYTGSVTATKLKVTGIDLFSAGDFGEAKDRQDIVLRDAARGRLQAPRAQGEPHRRRRPLRRDRRRVLVLRSPAQGGGRLGTARHPDLRPVLRRRRSPGPYGGRCSLAG